MCHGRPHGMWNFVSFLVSKFFYVHHLLRMKLKKIMKSAHRSECVDMGVVARV